MAVQAGNENREEIEAKEAEMRALGAEPDIYQKLTASVAPSIWQMDDVKKGILAQLFGGSSKVHLEGPQHTANPQSPFPMHASTFAARS